jgi:hypothetical protein
MNETDTSSRSTEVEEKEKAMEENGDSKEESGLPPAHSEEETIGEALGRLDTEYQHMSDKQNVLLQMLEKLQAEESSLSKALALAQKDAPSSQATEAGQISKQPQAQAQVQRPTKKRKQEEEAVKRLQEALLASDDESSSSDDHNSDDESKISISKLSHLADD